MILLDTNYMIVLVSRDVEANTRVREWLQEGRSIVTSSSAWAEFCTGPIDPADLRSIEALLEDRIIPLGKTEAECAARLYRAGKCTRADRIDTFIAATAIIAEASLATRNLRDFNRFVPFGLKLA